MRGADALVNMLENLGIEYIFGLCGDTSLPFYESLSGSKSSLKHILTRDERSASYMADAYARLSGRVGICEAPSGAGAIYMMPGVAEANQSSVPLVALTSDIDVSHCGRGTLTELDQEGIFRPITKWTKTVNESSELAWSVRQAFLRAVSGSLGAVHLGFPLNVQESKTSDSDVYIDSKYSYYPVLRPPPDPDTLRNVANILINSRRPVIVAGAGVIRSGAWVELETLAQLLGCPVATSISGKGAISETHPYSLGVIGSNGGVAYRHDFVMESDLIFFVGCRAGSVTTDKWTLPYDNSTNIIQLDVDPNRIGMNYKILQGIVSDAKLGLGGLIDVIGNHFKGRSESKIDSHILEEKKAAFMQSVPEFHSDDIPIRPERFVHELSQALPENTIVIADAGTPVPYLAAYLKVSKAGRFFISPRAHGALGYALPASVGASFSHPESKIVSVMGDGSFAMGVGELETIVRYNLSSIVLIVLSNSCYGWIKAGQKARGSNYFGVDFLRTDHASVARAYGIQAYRVEDPRDLGFSLTKALEASSAVLIDVLIQPLHEANAPVSKWIA